MTFFQPVSVGGGLALALSVAVSPLIPQPPIVIHDLVYANGVVTQDRTVTTDGPWTGIWEADIIDTKTGEVVENCHGEGVWDYPPGRRRPEIPFREWVGNKLCELPPGEYQLVAIYRAGTFKTLFRGDVFKVE